MIVVWSKNAKDDLVNYKQKSSIFTEEKIEDYINSLVDYVNNLGDFHKLGKFLFNRGNSEIRQLIYREHRIFYSVNNDTINILNVYHFSKNIENK